MRGSWRGKESANDPTVDPREPELPDGTTEEVAAVWNQLVPLLLRMGVLTTIDGRALARYCQVWLWWVECCEHIKKYGMTYPVKAEDGSLIELVEWPQVRRSLNYSTELRKLENEFGMTPAARSRITVPDKPDTTKNDKKRFFA